MSTPKIGSRPAPAEEPAAPEKGKNKLIPIIIGVLVLVIAGGAYWFLMGPGAAGATEEETTTEDTAHAEPSYTLSDIVTVESVSINLAGGHYLRIGLGLQTATVVGAEAGGDGETELSTAKALDAAIALFSGRTIEELSDPVIREDLKYELAEQLKEIYHYEVVDVYYTDFVTQ